MPPGVLLYALSFWAFNHWDNKYTRPGSRPIAGLLAVTADEAAACPLRHLIRGWEFYPGLLPAPRDFAGSGPRYCG